jgi:hypothetical protein
VDRLAAPSPLARESRRQRFLAVTGDFISMLDIAGVLKRALGAAAARVPTRQLPNWLVRIASLRDPAVKQILPELGRAKRDERQSPAPARLVAALGRGNDRRHGRKSAAAGVVEGESKSGLRNPVADLPGYSCRRATTASILAARRAG